MRNRKIKNLSYLLLLLAVFPVTTLARQFVLVISQDDIKDLGTDATAATETDSTEPGFDDFIDSDAKPDHELDPGSWSPIFEPGTDPVNQDEQEAAYYQAVRKMVTASSRGDARGMEEAASEMEATAAAGHPHAQSVMGFLYGMGMVRERNKAKSFLYHHFASEGGNMQSKMALAYAYTRQEVSLIPHNYQLHTCIQFNLYFI